MPPYSAPVATVEEIDSTATPTTSSSSDETIDSTENDSIVRRRCRGGSPAGDNTHGDSLSRRMQRDEQHSRGKQHRQHRKRTKSTTTAEVESASPSPSVRFAPYADFREVKHIDDYTEDEIFNIWFTDDEYDEFKKSCKRTVKMMTAGMAIGKDDHDFCCRGLECRTKEGSKLRIRRRINHRTIVLAEQDKSSDDEALGKRARDASMLCGLDAVSRGLIDEMQANEIYGRKNTTKAGRDLTSIISMKDKSGQCISTTPTKPRPHRTLSLSSSTHSQSRTSFSSSKVGARPRNLFRTKSSASLMTPSTKTEKSSTPCPKELLQRMQLLQ